MEKTFQYWELFKSRSYWFNWRNAKRYWPTIVGAIVGAIGGYLYWRYVGCSTDTCPITSSPLNSTLWGTAMGGLLGNILQPNIIKKNNQDK